MGDVLVPYPNNTITIKVGTVLYYKATADYYYGNINYYNNGYSATSSGVRIKSLAPGRCGFNDGGSYTEKWVTTSNKIESSTHDCAESSVELSMSHGAPVIHLIVDAWPICDDPNYNRVAARIQADTISYTQDPATGDIISVTISASKVYRDPDEIDNSSYQILTPYDDSDYPPGGDSSSSTPDGDSDSSTSGEGSSSSTPDGDSDSSTSGEDSSSSLSSSSSSSAVPPPPPSDLEDPDDTSESDYVLYAVPLTVNRLKNAEIVTPTIYPSGIRINHDKPAYVAANKRIAKFWWRGNIYYYPLVDFLLRQAADTD